MEAKGRSTARLLSHAVLAVVAALTICPFLLVLSISFSEEGSVVRNGYRLIPKKISLDGYAAVFKNPGILVHAYGVTIVVTILGTLVGLLLTAMIAYVISRKEYPYRKATTLFVVFTMLFNGGLVPFYILIVKYLHLKDTLWVLIVPYLINPFYVMIMKGFLDRMPAEVIESAKIDGAGEYRAFFTIVLPLSTPALATVGLFISFIYWNDWWLGLLFIDRDRLVPLQLLLYRVMNSIEFYAVNSQHLSGSVDTSQFPSLTTRMALAVLGAGPMLFIFPFFQRYFVKGLTVGSLKE
jgi:putative aldouronate transport system permease protein